MYLDPEHCLAYTTIDWAEPQEVHFSTRCWSERHCIVLITGYTNTWYQVRRLPSHHLSPPSAKTELQKRPPSTAFFEVAVSVYFFQRDGWRFSVLMFIET